MRNLETEKTLVKWRDVCAYINGQRLNDKEIARFWVSKEMRVYEQMISDLEKSQRNEPDLTKYRNHLLKLQTELQSYN